MCGVNSAKKVLLNLGLLTAVPWCRQEEECSPLPYLVAALLAFPRAGAEVARVHVFHATWCTSMLG